METIILVTMLLYFIVLAEGIVLIRRDIEELKELINKKL